MSVEEILCCKFAYETGTGGIETEIETETETVDGLHVQLVEDHRIEDRIEDRIDQAE